MTAPIVEIKAYRDDVIRALLESIRSTMIARGITLAGRGVASPGTLGEMIPVHRALRDDELDAALVALARHACQALLVYQVEVESVDLDADGFDSSERDYDPDEDRTP